MTRRMTLSLVFLAILAWAGIVTSQLQVAITSSGADGHRTATHAGRAH